MYVCSYTGQNKYIASNVKTIVSNCGSLFIALLNHYVGPERQFNFCKILRIFKDNYIQNCYKVAENSLESIFTSIPFGLKLE